MPWSISKRDGQYCVVKTGTNDVAGCHSSRDEAADQIRALYANEADMDEMESEMIPSISFDEHGSIPAEHLREMQRIAGELRRLADQLDINHEPMTDENMEEPSTQDEIMPNDMPSQVEYISWAGPITYEGVFTGDNRFFREDAVTWDTELFPIPFKWQRVSADGHDASVTIGRVDLVYRKENGEIWGEGVILLGEDTPPEGREYITLLRNGAAGGVSIDGDDAEFEIQVDPDTQDSFIYFSHINIRALTAVDIPAFAGAKIKLKDESFRTHHEVAKSIVASVIGSTNLPIADRNREWDGTAAASRIFEWATTDDKFDVDKLERAFLWKDSEADSQNRGSYKLPFTDVLDGILTIIPRGVFAAAAVLQGARGGVDIPSDDLPGIERKLLTIYNRISEMDKENPITPPFSSHNRITSAEVDALIASLIPVDPPTSWFEEPKLKELTPVTITDEGRIYGHIASRNCHISYGSCTTPPRNCDYDTYFHLGALRTLEGEEIAVGHMTFGGGHADINLSSSEALRRYDSTSRVSADIRAGEDEFGTWIVGALRPGFTPAELREIRSAPLSGDWRPIAGKHQLIAAHGVNVPGFPIPRVKALVASGQTQGIIITEAQEGCMCDEISTEQVEFEQLLFQLDIEELESDKDEIRQ